MRRRPGSPRRHLRGPAQRHGHPRTEGRRWSADVPSGRQAKQRHDACLDIADGHVIAPHDRSGSGSLIAGVEASRTLEHARLGPPSPQGRLLTLYQGGRAPSSPRDELKPLSRARSSGGRRRCDARRDLKAAVGRPVPSSMRTDAAMSAPPSERWRAGRARERRLPGVGRRSPSGSRPGSPPNASATAPGERLVLGLDLDHPPACGDRRWSTAGCSPAAQRLISVSSSR